MQVEYMSGVGRESSWFKAFWASVVLGWLESQWSIKRKHQLVWPSSATHCFTFPFTEKNLKKSRNPLLRSLHLFCLTRSASPRRPDSWKRGAWYIAAEIRAPFTVVVLPCTPSIKTATRPIMCTPVLISCPAAYLATSEDSNPRGNGFHLPP